MTTVLVIEDEQERILERVYYGSRQRGFCIQFVILRAVGLAGGEGRPGEFACVSGTEIGNRVVLGRDCPVLSGLAGVG